MPPQALAVLQPTGLLLLVPQLWARLGGLGATLHLLTGEDVDMLFQPAHHIRPQAAPIMIFIFLYLFICLIISYLLLFICMYTGMIYYLYM